MKMFREECIFAQLVCIIMLAVVNGGALAQNLSLQERIQIGTDAIKIGCGLQSKESNVEVVAADDGSITLKQLPNTSSSSQINYSSRETIGLIAAFQKKLNDEGSILSEKQLDCMRTYVDRIVNSVLPPPKSEQTLREEKQACFSTCDIGLQSCNASIKSEYGQCIEERRQVCIKACYSGYRMPMTDCIATLCQPDNGTNKFDWAQKCNNQIDLGACDAQRATCRQACL